MPEKLQFNFFFLRKERIAGTHHQHRCLHVLFFLEQCQLFPGKNIVLMEGRRKPLHMPALDLIELYI